MISFLFFPASPALNTEGVITHAPAGTGMPPKNAFGTPSAGVLQTLSLD